MDNFKTTRILYFQFRQLDCLHNHKRLSIKGSKIALFHDQVWKDSYHLVINSFHLLLLSFKSMFAKLFDCTTTKDFLHPILLFGKNSPKEPRLVHFKHIAQVLAPPKNESFISCLLRSGLLPWIMKFVITSNLFESWRF